MIVKVYGPKSMFPIVQGSNLMFHIVEANLMFHIVEGPK